MQPESEFTPSSMRAALSSWLGLFFGPNTMVSAPMSLFMVPIATTFHLTRVAVSSILLIAPITTAVLSPFAGRFLDRFGFRTTVLLGLSVFGASSMLRGFAASPAELGICFALVSVGSAINSSVSYSKLITLWFSKNRGLMLGLAVALGAGAGSALAPQIMRPLIKDFGWRLGYIYSGAFLLVVVLPAMALLLREPSSKAPAAFGQKSGYGLTLTEALRTRSFWFLLFAVFLASMSLIGTNAHAVPMLTERGFSTATAVTEISVFFIGGVVGQLTCGVVADRVDSQLVVAPYYGFGLIGLLIVHTTTRSDILLPGGFVMGLGQGAEIAFSAYLTSRYFGVRAYGTIYALYYAISSAGIATGLLAMGVAHDWAHTYRPMVLVFGGAMAVAVILVSLLGPYRYASRHSKLDRPEVVTNAAS